MDFPLPTNAVLIAPSGDGTGATDSAALQEVLEQDDAVAVLESAATYFDDGTPLVFAAGARVITTDSRPAFWRRGYFATTSMNAMPGCLNTSEVAISMVLPPAASWPEQTVTCEPTEPVVVTVEAAEGDVIGAAGAIEVGGMGDRLVIQSRGCNKLVPLSGGTATSRRVWGGSVFSVEESLFFSPGPLNGGTDGELGNYEFLFGRLRASTGFSNGTAIVFKDAYDGTVLVDYQPFGDTTPTNVRYMREAFFTGYRIQMLASEPSRGYVVSALGLNIPILFELGNQSNSLSIVAVAANTSAIHVGGDGTVRLASAPDKSFTIQNGSDVVFEADSTGIGLNGAPPVPRGVITGSRSNPAQILAQLLAYLSARGDIIDETTE